MKNKYRCRDRKEGSRLVRKETLRGQLPRRSSNQQVEKGGILRLAGAKSLERRQ